MDITRVFNEALDKIERGYGASQKLYSALEGVQHELGGNQNSRQAAAMIAYVDALREKMALPDLQSVLDARTHPATVSVRTSVKDAAKIMKEHRTTAVCVMDNLTTVGSGGHVSHNVDGHQRIAGIFTSKDIVLRVIAAGLQPDRCSVVRVMTPHPDRAPPSMTIQEALRKMYNGHYLNMPVVEDDGKLVAIVDVLKLTYAILEQINTMSQEHNDGDEGNGPMWGKFFGTLAAAPDDNESVVSGSRDVASPQGERNNSELHPNDSASVVDHGADADASQIGINPTSSVIQESGQGLIDEHVAVFKFVSPSQRIHRFESPTLSLEHLRDIVAGKLSMDPFFSQHTEKAPTSEDEAPAPAPDPYDFSLLYEDDDGDQVVMSADSDVKDAVIVAQKKRQTRVLLIVNGGKGWEGINIVKPTEDKTTVVSKEENINQYEAPEEVEQIEKKVEQEVNESLPHEAHTNAHFNEHKHHSHANEGDVFGIPRDLILPAAIAFAGGAVLIAFIGTKLSSK